MMQLWELKPSLKEETGLSGMDIRSVHRSSHAVSLEASAVMPLNVLHLIRHLLPLSVQGKACAHCLKRSCVRRNGTQEGGEEEQQGRTDPRREACPR